MITVFSKLVVNLNFQIEIQIKIIKEMVYPYFNCILPRINGC